MTTIILSIGVSIILSIIGTYIGLWLVDNFYRIKRCFNKSKITYLK